MRSLVVATLVAFVKSASAVDKNEDKGKDAAVAFLKAVKAKDADAVMKASAVPFAYKDGEKIATLTELDSLKKWVKERLAEVKVVNDIPTEVAKITPFSELKDKIKDEEMRKTIEDVVGKDGFIAYISVDGKTIPLLVRIKESKAVVVGLAK